MRRTVWGPDGRVYFSDLVANRVGVLTLQTFCSPAWAPR